MKSKNLRAFLFLHIFFWIGIATAQSDPYAVRDKDVVYSPSRPELIKPDPSKPFTEEGKKIITKESSLQKSTPDESKKMIIKDSAVQKNSTESKVQLFDDAKKKCIELGFRAGTDRFGNCVLTLTK